MLDWLASPIDASRAHEVGVVISWHARLMVLSWGVAFPLGVVLARFFKIWPRQSWPDELDNQNWWRGHLALQWGGAALASAGLGLVLWQTGIQGYDGNWHRLFGWAAMALLLLQILSGLLRGTKGGPTQPSHNGSLHGDHYSMTTRRVWFEYMHKLTGYVALGFGAIAIALGLWQSNAIHALWLLIGFWWVALLCAAVYFQIEGRTVDTYQAIWGKKASHPGNKKKPIGWGISRR